MKGIKRNNAVGKKGRSGRRTLSEELIKRAAELNQVEISKRLVNRHLMAMEEDRQSDVEELTKIAMPIVLRDMGEKLKGDTEHPLIIKVAKDVIEKYDTNSEAGNNSEG